MLSLLENTGRVSVSPARPRTAAVATGLPSARRHSSCTCATLPSPARPPKIFCSKETQGWLELAHRRSSQHGEIHHCPPSTVAEQLHMPQLIVWTSVWMSTQGTDVHPHHCVRCARGDLNTVVVTQASCCTRLIYMGLESAARVQPMSTSLQMSRWNAHCGMICFLISIQNTTQADLYLVTGCSAAGSHTMTATLDLSAMCENGW